MISTKPGLYGTLGNYYQASGVSQMVTISRVCMFAQIRLCIALPVMLFLSSCAWHGVEPIFERVKTTDQFDRASAIVFGQVIDSRRLRHKEVVPQALVSPETKTVKCDAVEKTVKVWQVLKGPSNLGSDWKVYTYEFIGVPGLTLTSSPAIFFLTRQGRFWRPVSDFGQASIPLPGFPTENLPLKGFSNAPNPSGALIDVLLDPRNALDWLSYGDVVGQLINVSSDLASAAGLLRNDPAFMTRRVAVLAESSNGHVAAVASWQLSSMTGLCNERWARHSDVFLEVLHKNFLDGKIYAESGKSSADQETTYWRLKALSCSTEPEIRRRAEMLLKRYFAGRLTAGCDVCIKAEQVRLSREKNESAVGSEK